MTHIGGETRSRVPPEHQIAFPRLNKKSPRLLVEERSYYVPLCCAGFDG